MFITSCIILGALALGHIMPFSTALIICAIIWIINGGYITIANWFSSKQKTRDPDQKYEIIYQQNNKHPKIYSSREIKQTKR